MATPAQLSPLLPLTKEDFDWTTTPLEEDPDVEQIQVDVSNVVEGRVALSSFPEAYQEKIKNYYRFSATRHSTGEFLSANTTRDTMDLV